jgi:hypothetical protein
MPYDIIEVVGMDKKFEEFINVIDLSDIAKEKLRSLYKHKKELDHAEKRLNISLSLFLVYFLILVGLPAYQYQWDMAEMFLGIIKEWEYLVFVVLGGSYYVYFPKRFKKDKSDSDDDYHSLRKEIIEEINDYHNAWGVSHAEMTTIHLLINQLDHKFNINLKHKSK